MIGRAPVAWLAAIAAVLFAGAEVHAEITLDMVTVGNPGNAGYVHRTAGTFGSVDHVYQIGKYEVTTGQYREFLNAKAA